MDETQLRKTVDDYARENGLTINEKVYKLVVKRQGMCPCRTDNTPCPCKYAPEDIAKTGYCHCRLYKKK